MITFQNVSKTYHDTKHSKTALSDISFHVEKSEIFGIIGESGAGKSTTLKLLNALERPSSGQIILDGTNLRTLSKKQLTDTRKTIGVIFQNINLLKNKTVFDNVALPLKIKGKVNKEDVEAALKFVNMFDHAHKYPRQLSGGEKQRVAIARALVTKPDILICDEPTSALDQHTTFEILEVLKQINQEFQTTIVIVTHELSVAKTLCNRVAILEKGHLIDVISVNNTKPKATVSSYSDWAKEVLEQ
ncbi:MAG: ATP-binding cassette domain-containing protein [Erysipelothrix sp.]